MRRRIRTGRTLAAGCALLALLNCRHEPPVTAGPEPYRDLIAELALASQHPAGGPGPRAEARGDSLFVPHGVRIHYALELPPAGQLVLDEVRAVGESAGVLRVALAVHEGERRTLATLRGGPGRVEVPWRLEGPRIVRLVLSAGPPAAGADGGFLLRRPTLWSEEPAGARLAGVEPGASSGTSAGPGPERPGPRRPNVLLYLVDSLRADRLGCYGRSQPVSPSIDAFARQAVLFENAVAQSSWTKSGVASIFTGLWPRDHRAVTRQDRLPAAAATLAELLRAAGYRTAAFSANPSIAPEFGFDQGFEEFELLDHETRAEELTDLALGWLAGRGDREPFFLYVHTLDPHDPYLPPPAEHRRWAPAVPRELAAASGRLLNRLNTGRLEPTGSLAEDLQALYDGEIAANDRAFGRLVDALAARGLTQSTLVIFVADHGEDFGEHGVWRHGRRLHGEAIRIPLLIRPPGGRPARRVEQLVQQVDLLPTVLGVAGLEPPRGLEGRSLAPLLRGGSLDQAPAYLLVSYVGPTRVGVIDRGWKLLGIFRDGRLRRPELYDLAADPLERVNLAAEHPILRDHLATLVLRRMLLERPPLAGETAEIDPETEEALRALGYVG